VHNCIRAEQGRTVLKTAGNSFIHDPLYVSYVCLSVELRIDGVSVRLVGELSHGGV
jgi:hypothetical protein